MSHLNRCKIKSHRCPAGFAESVPPVFFVTNKQNEFALTSSVPGDEKNDCSIYLFSQKSNKILAPNLLNNLFSCDFNFMPFSSCHHHAGISIIGHFCVRMLLRMNINLELMKRMVQSVFGVVGRCIMSD